MHIPMSRVEHYCWVGLGLVAWWEIVSITVHSTEGWKTTYKSTTFSLSTNTENPLLSALLTVRQKTVHFQFLPLLIGLLCTHVHVLSSHPLSPCCDVCTYMCCPHTRCHHVAMYEHALAYKQTFAVHCRTRYCSMIHGIYIGLCKLALHNLHKNCTIRRPIVQSVNILHNNMERYCTK